MLIAVLDFSTSADDRPRALEQLDREGDEVRAMRGNRAFRAFAARDDATGVTVLHEWDDQDTFAGYLASEAFARSSEVIRPLMTTAPVSRRFRAEILEIVR